MSTGKLRALIDYAQSLAFFLLAAIAMHEGFHVASASIFGVEGVIHLDVHWLFWLGGWVEWASWPSEGIPMWAVAFIYWAGGGLTGLMLLWAYAFERDREDRLWELSLGLYQLGYAAGETLLPFRPDTWMAVAALLGGVGAIGGALTWVMRVHALSR